jgi:hypothetical protein
VISGPLRSHWSNSDNPKPIAAMKAARDWIIQYKSASVSRAHSTEHKALDTLVHVVTGKADALVGGPEHCASRHARAGTWKLVHKSLPNGGIPRGV